jgi:hypothetical protein
VVCPGCLSRHPGALVIYDVRCDKCDVVETIQLPMSEAGNWSVCPTCNGNRHKVYGDHQVMHRPWMSDANISSNKRHEAWLRTPEAKAMPLELDRNNE